MSKQRESLFRQKALQQLSSAEKLDQLIQVVSPKDWLPLVILSILGFSGLIWAIFGRIPITVRGEGILIHPRRIITLQSAIAGELTALNIDSGQCIEKGTILANIDPKSQKQQLKHKQERFIQLQQQTTQTTTLRNQRKTLEKQEIEAQKRRLQQRLKDVQSNRPKLYEQELISLKQQRSILENRLKNRQDLTPIIQEQESRTLTAQKESIEKQLQDARELSPILKNRLEKRQQLIEQGAIAEEVVLQAEQEYRENGQRIIELTAQLRELSLEKTEIQQRYLDNLNEIEDIKGQLQQLNAQDIELQQKSLDTDNEIAQLNTDIQQLETRLKQLEQETVEAANLEENQIQQVRQEIEWLKQEIKNNSVIKSPYQGCLLEITATVGQYVEQGTSLGTLQTQTQQTKVVGVSYFPLGQGSQIKQGLKALVTPDTVQKSRYGGIVAEISEVSPFPVTTAGVASLIGNPEVARQLIGDNEGKFEVIVELSQSSATISGYQWSSSQGPPLKFSLGTTTSVSVIVEERAPITFILPILREWIIR